jgi:PadR family transcriptional regulator PadR
MPYDIDSQMLKGVLAFLLLHVVAQEDGYGYAIVNRLKAAGFADLAESTVYPALTRLEHSGQLGSYLVKSDSGPARKYYRITDAGREALQRSASAWHTLVTAVGAVTNPSDLEEGA